MALNPRISLEQWRSLLAVVDAGGYAQAAAVLHKSQSAVTYAVQKMESLLGVKIFEVIGRKARLTATGQVLYRRAKALLEEAGTLESAAGSLAAGWEPEIKLAVEIVFPTWLLLEALSRFAGDRLMPVRFIAAAHPDHPLHRLGRALTLQDLRKYRHLVIRDSGSQRRGGTWLGAEQIWTVSQKATSIHAATLGLGFAWFPEDTIRSELASGKLAPLPLREGGERWADLYLVFADRDYAGPGALRLAEIIRGSVAELCTQHPPRQDSGSATIELGTNAVRDGRGAP